jgi:exopolyphosphatase/guanosine-5'-triphosphate,3'-diphosphate pyrophosphatase
VKLAAIDIGTNSIHMVVVETQGRRGFEVIDREKTMVKLGAGLFGPMHLTERAMNAGLDVLRRYCKLAESRGVEEILAVATSAAREADNATEFLDMVFRETGLVPRVISGTEEARLIFLAARQALDFGLERTMVIDIGGGSVEIAVGDAQEVQLCQSLRLGVQRLLARQGNAEPLGMRQLHELGAYIEGAATDVFNEARRFGYRKVVGSSGTIRALGEAANSLSGGAPWRSVNAQVARRKDLRELTRKLCELDEQRRARIAGIGDARADTIHLGGALLVRLLEMAAVEEVTLTDASLREGVILDYLEKHGSSLAHRPIADPRRRSVVELARKYERDDPREQHIAKLALELFDQTASVHGLKAVDRQLLEYAALLHGIGRHINFHDRHRHARYIIRNSALRGFTDAEVELLALIVFYHRRKRPKSKQPRLKELSETDFRSLSVLSALLRLAVALDRGHCQLVRHVRAELTPQLVRIDVQGSGDLELELWSARQELEPLSHALGRAVSVGAQHELASVTSEPMEEEARVP